MHNLTNSKDLADILDRVDKLSTRSRAQWGKMTVQIMLCHTADYFRMMYGDIPTKRRHSYLSQNFMKWWVMRLEKLPRLMLTVPEMDPKLGNQTPPTSFDNDLYLLKKFILGFAILRESDLVPHPRFGKLNKSEFGRLSYLHLDHHLRQFGC
ncbi:MAG: DUF1569 domain-containing protein [Saprospiraceae bacterium]|nr:DUF1569 domain-containing protein [Saprospiraceae bacterium]